MKAVLHFRASPAFRQQLLAAAPDWLEVAIVDEADEAAFRREMLDAEVLLHVLTPVSAAMIAAAPRLRLIQKIGVGVNTIDLDAARARGIAVANMPGTNSQAVAEMTLALMLAALRRIPLLDRATRECRGWTLPPENLDPVGEIAGRTVGLIGYGEVPRRLAPVLQALGASVLYTARSRKAEAGGEFLALPQLLAAADIVSLHVPLTPETERMIDAAALARMKPGAVLVNTARGGLVDEAALVQALQSGRLRAAGVDVLAVEPAGAGLALARLDNVVMTPHVAWLTAETLARSLDVAIENCRRLRDAHPLLNEVKT
ncbi:MAG: hydroxyacid dehydrogenase [Betaproteobacteria bacterium]|nr:hydroxyacid dehydrogenase [Betaproteobacteria bacterium]